MSDRVTELRLQALETGKPVSAFDAVVEAHTLLKYGWEETFFKSRPDPDRVRSALALLDLAVKHWPKREQ